VVVQGTDTISPESRPGVERAFWVLHLVKKFDTLIVEMIGSWMEQVQVGVVPMGVSQSWWALYDGAQILLNIVLSGEGYFPGC
jgi:hypothetical protein